MATTKTTKTTTETIEAVKDPVQEAIDKVEHPEYVLVRLPMVKGDDSAVFVSVNDYRCQIKRGCDVKVPWFVAEALRDAEDAEVKLIESIAASSK